MQRTASLKTSLPACAPRGRWRQWFPPRPGGAAAGLDVEQLIDVAAAAEHRAQNAVARGRRFHDHGGGTVAEQNTRVAVLPVDESAQSFTTDDQHTARVAGDDERIGHAQGVEKTTTGGVEIESGGAVGGETLLNQATRGRQQMIGGGGGDR